MYIGLRQAINMLYEKVTPETVPYMAALCRELHSLGSYRDVPVDEVYLYNFIMNAACDPENWFTMLAKDDDGYYVGMVAGMIVPMVFTPRRIGIEHAWYVREGTPNRGKVAKQLMQNFVDWAVMERDAMHVQAGDVANINSVAVDGLYRLLKFKRAGTIYMYKEAT